MALTPPHSHPHLPHVHTWQVVAAILPTMKPVNIGVVNGVYTPRGAHFRYIRKILGAATADRMNKLAGSKRGAKAPSVTDACRYLSLFVVAPLPNSKDLCFF